MTSQDATINRGRFEPSEFLFLIRIQRKHSLFTYLELATRTAGHFASLELHL
jgi:hypothetical protein